MNTIFQVVTLAWSLQGGQYVNSAIIFSEALVTNENYFFETSFEFQIPFSWTKGDANHLFIGADTETQFYPNPKASTSFIPWQDTYSLNVGVRVLGVELGYQHLCSHPIVPNNMQNISKLNYAYDKVYAKVSGEF